MKLTKYEIQMGAMPIATLPLNEVFAFRCVPATTSNGIAAFWYRGIIHSATHVKLTSTCLYPISGFTHYAKVTQQLKDSFIRHFETRKLPIY